jgi:hypothetical protein
MDNGGDIDAAGNVRPAAEYLRRWEAQALKHREQLGISPLARARMGRDVAAGSVDMAKLMADLEDDRRDAITPASPGAETEDGEADG